jgi:nucleoside-diphosphate-sugar epimerase
MNVLVTGATGYLGAEIVAQLLEAGASVIAWGRNPDRLAAIQARFSAYGGAIKVESVDLSGVRSVPAETDVVVHAAAIRPPMSKANPGAMERVNVEGSQHIAQLAEQSRCRRLVYLSTQAVYGSHGAPWTEDSQVAPETGYGRSKLAGELEVLRSRIRDVVILRSARLYGVTPMARWDELPGRFARAVASGQTLMIHGNGEQRFDLVHVRDASRAVAQAAMSPDKMAHAIYNVGSGRSVSVNELVALFVELAGEFGFPRARIEHRSQEVEDARRLEMDITKIGANLGWSPEIPLREGMAEYLTRASQSH